MLTSEAAQKYVWHGQVGRAYARVCRRKLRRHLLQQCQQHGVNFLNAEVSNIDIGQGSNTLSTVGLVGGTNLKAR